MTECPQCFANFKGYKCTCGYTPRNSVAFIADAPKRDERVLTEQAQSWLAHNGIHKPGMTRAEKTKANFDYMKRLAATAKKSELEPHAWAYEVLTKISDGEVVSAHAEKMARDVSGVERIAA
jgi:hypothetical protein